MKQTISFRRAIKQDVSFLLTLRKRSMGQHLSQAGLGMSDLEHLERIDECFNESFLILANGDAIGLVKLGKVAQALHIRQFQLLPEYQSIGIGSKVLKVVKKQAAKLRLPVTLNVLLENPAQKFYARHGFKIIEKNTLEYRMKYSKGS